MKQNKENHYRFDFVLIRLQDWDWGWPDDSGSDRRDISYYLFLYVTNNLKKARFLDAF